MNDPRLQRLRGQQATADVAGPDAGEDGGRQGLDLVADEDGG